MSKHATWERLAHLFNAVEDHLAKALQRKHGISLSEYRALQHLAAVEGGELRMQDLAARLNLNQSSVSRLVLRLERDGYAGRDLCPDDGRGVYTVLTDLGRERAAAMAPDYRRLLDAAVEQALVSTGDGVFAARVRALAVDMAARTRPRR